LAVTSSQWGVGALGNTAKVPSLRQCVATRPRTFFGGWGVRRYALGKKVGRGVYTKEAFAAAVKNASQCFFGTVLRRASSWPFHVHS